MQEKTPNALTALLKRLFAGAQNDDSAVVMPLGSASNVIQQTRTYYTQNPSDIPQANFSTSADEVFISDTLPADRLSRYQLFELMAQSPTISAALAIHVWHALAPDRLSGKCFKYAPNDINDAAAQKICDELNDDLQTKLQAILPSIALMMCIYGVAYVRPHPQTGIGIVQFDNSFFTLPHFIREFCKGNEPAGFAGEYLLDPVSKRRVLAKPWDMLVFKNPMWTPKRSEIPTDGRGYNLMAKPEEAEVTENLNRGNSFLEYSLEAWSSLNAALASMKATRNNAAKIDRLIAVATGNLSPAQGANFINGLGQHLKRNQDAVSAMAQNGNVTPSVLNHFIPVQADGKGGITIDTQSTSADISGIEDIMLHLRRLAGSLGIDASMLGWQDSMSGGLGEGGFLNVSIQAAQRAEWIRMAATKFVMDAAAIHMAWKRNEGYPDGVPYHAEFNSLNTAIAEQEASEQEGRANFISVLVQNIIEILESPQMANSDTLHQWLFAENMKMPPELVDKIFKELNETAEPAPAVATPERPRDNALFESAMPAPDLSRLPLRANNRDAPYQPLPSHLYPSEAEANAAYDLSVKFDKTRLPRDFGSEASKAADIAALNQML